MFSTLSENSPNNNAEAKTSAFGYKYGTGIQARARDARPEPPPSTITFQEYIATAKELQVHQRILLRLADRRLRSYLRAAPTPPPSPDRSAPASTLQSAAQPADTSGPPLPVWRLIRLDTPPPPQKPRLDPRLLPTDPRRYRAPLNGAQTPPLPEEIEREQRRKATHPQLALFLAKHPAARTQRKKEANTDETLSLLRKRRITRSRANEIIFELKKCFGRHFEFWHDCLNLFSHTSSTRRGSRAESPDRIADT
ncbi:unnamed protein product [Trichogramma brassicae]|uniref:Uncharacterized protein n=1 Tax=Trichogramma brassicae TaxID=86971 RepID=A0A6H5IZF9_9HYME|nr:unnamed protein product [Trichogramma brassicae]